VVIAGGRVVAEGRVDGPSLRRALGLPGT
jgi:hypothetical protein